MRFLRINYVRIFIVLILAAFSLASYPLVAQTAKATPTPADTTTPAPTVTSRDAATFVWRTDGGDNKLGRPDSVVTDSHGNIYVVDGDHDRIQKFDTNGNSLMMWGKHGNGDEQFVFRMGVSHTDALAIDAQDVLYVLDSSARVQKFDTNGKFLGLWGTIPTSSAPPIDPNSMVIDHQGNLYIAYGFNRPRPEHPTFAQKFDPKGQLITTWGVSSTLHLEAQGITGFAIDAQDNLYAVSSDNHIWKFDGSGKLLAMWGSTGIGDGQFNDAQGIAIDFQGNIYVGDSQGNRIEKFDANGKFLGQWGSQGGGDGQFHYVFQVAVDNAGNIYVTSDGDFDRLQKFSPVGDIASETMTPAATAAGG